MLKVLFVCVHNSARSQMAEAFFNLYAKDVDDTAQSAGIKPGKLNPYVVRAMAEKEVDISDNTPKAVFDLYKEGKRFTHVIAVCDEASQQCPIFPGINKIIAWSFSDPSSFKGSDEEIMQKVRSVRDEIEAKVKDFIQNS
ncbi:arsenate reductase ArsC [Sulfurimonas sp. CVO]|jgi:arsenate reductase|uniref:Arsenate reductase ArsC n=1 Tax=Sulfurimonas xiamenensis TaxID=2590021 RepID=A0AAJ4A254_9BACT|nr:MULTISPECIES: arsenate reductase ArsC [Sulfurimonas]PLY13718.1 MAG: arsenate reductase ArsC [Sulfurimonas sp.]QFR42469.1 arsenate reductase ArsC [Sulfurimonas xiamenensis]QHG91955.1 arsenate reductase ArsC [Sulfurimonas sp. CVO]